jgi:hypothetical protein
VRAVLEGNSAKKQADLKSWEEESLQKCFHTDELKQYETKIEAKGILH